MDTKMIPSTGTELRTFTSPAMLWRGSSPGQYSRSMACRTTRTASMAETALIRLEDDEALVPQLWHLELRNCLLVARRRGRFTVDGPTERLNALRDLPIRTDMEPDFERRAEAGRSTDRPAFCWPTIRLRAQRKPMV